MENLDFWNSVEKTDVKFAKQIEVSRQLRTVIHAQYKKKIITEKFGMYGKGWGVCEGSENFERIHYGNETCLLQYTATAFYVFDGEKESDKDIQVTFWTLLRFSVRSSNVTCISLSDSFQHAVRYSFSSLGHPSPFFLFRISFFLSITRQPPQMR